MRLVNSVRRKLGSISWCVRRRRDGGGFNLRKAIERERGGYKRKRLVVQQSS